MEEDKKFKSIDSMIINNADVMTRKNGIIKSIFGHRTSMYYKPSGSIITKKVRTFPARCLEKICWLVNQGELVRCETMTYNPNGNVMLTCYLSRDNRFLLIQASRCFDFEFIPITDAISYKDSEAETIIDHMRKGGIL